MKPKVTSVVTRLFMLNEQIQNFAKVVRTLGMPLGVDPLKTQPPSYTREQANILIDNYNSIIDDIKLNFAKKDSHVDKLGSLKSLDQPSINDVSKVLFIMGTSISQTVAYMVRWME